MFFGWLRKKAAEAILGGVQDACEIIERETPIVVAVPEGLAARLALPAPSETTTKKTQKTRE